MTLNVIPFLYILKTTSYRKDFHILIWINCRAHKFHSGICCIKTQKQKNNTKYNHKRYCKCAKKTSHLCVFYYFHFKFNPLTSVFTVHPLTYLMQRQGNQLKALPNILPVPKCLPRCRTRLKGSRW